MSWFSSLRHRLLFQRWRFLVFLLDFCDSPFKVGVQAVADEVASEGVCSGGDGEFSCEGSGDFATLPFLRIMQERGLEDESVFGWSGSCF
jgi:hypothetical protein